MSGGPLLRCDLAFDAAGAIAHNELTLSGWTAAPDGISGVVVTIDGRLLHAAYGLDTPWLAKDLSDCPGADRAGYSLHIDTSGWAPGPREVTITSFGQDGGRTDLEGKIDFLPFGPPKYTIEDSRAAIAAGDVAVWLEEPHILEAGCEVEGPVEIAGWAYCEAGVEAVFVTLDGRLHYEALRPIVRPDLLDEYGADVAGGGFALTLDPRDCPPGSHTLTVVAVDRQRRAVGVEGTFTRLPEPPDDEDPTPDGDAEAVDWIESRTLPRLRGARTERYDPDEHAGLVLEAEHQLRYRWAAPLAAGRAVLDAGCGLGWGAALLSGAGAERVIGVDLSEEALDRARRHGDPDRLEFCLGDLQSLPFEDATFDLVTCFEAIEHVPDPGRALEELRRVLRPDGVLLISTRSRRPSVGPGGERAYGQVSGEFEQTLRSQFAHVRVHRQETCLASVLGGDEKLAIDDGTTGVEIDVRSVAAASGPGGEICLIAVAGVGPLPELERMAVLTPPVAVRRLREQAHSLEDRTLLAEADAAASRNQSNLAQMHQRATLASLREKEKEMEAVQKEMEAVRAALDATQSELEQARERLQEASSERDEQVARLHEIEQIAERAQALATAREQSLSWRITRPLRSVKRATLLARSALRRDRSTAG